MSGVLGGTIGSYGAKLAPTFVGRTTAAQSAAGSVSLTGLAGGSNTSPSIGDIVIVSLAVGFDTAASTSPLGITGYTVIANLSSRAAAGDDLYYYTGYKVLTAADTSFTTTGFNSTNGGAVAVHVWRGVDQTTPMDVTRTTTNTIVGAFTSGPAITPVTENAMILSMVALGSDQSGRTWTNGSLSNVISGADPTSGQDSHTAIGSKLWTGGSFTPTGWSSNDDDGTSSGAAVTIALRPA